VGSLLQLIHIRLPRLDSVVAFLTALEFLSKDKTEISETDNVYELIAVAYFLGMPDLQNLCAKKMVKEMDHRKVIICGHLGAMSVVVFLNYFFRFSSSVSFLIFPLILQAEQCEAIEGMLSVDRNQSREKGPPQGHE
jgi:hypothetical protein